VTRFVLDRAPLVGTIFPWPDQLAMDLGLSRPSRLEDVVGGA
jgi:hypothetical protein